MKCQNCNAEIPPEWVNAIKSNICPGCGGAIMSEEIVTLMNDLAETISKMDFNAQEITGWLLSNYRLEKVGAGEPTGFHRAKVKESKTNEGKFVSPEAAEKIKEFQQRGDVSPSLIGKTKKDILHKLGQNISGEDIIDDEEYNEDSIGNEISDPKISDGLSPNEVLSTDEIERIAQAARKKRQSVGLDPDFAPSLYDGDSTFDVLPENAPPRFRAFVETQLQKNERSNDAITSGVRISKNSFSRG